MSYINVMPISPHQYIMWTPSRDTPPKGFLEKKRKRKKDEGFLGFDLEIISFEK